MKQLFTKALRILLTSIFVIAAIYLLVPRYLQKALIYLQPGITDHKIFDNRVVEASVPQPWPTAAYYDLLNPPEAYLDTLEQYRTVAFLVIHRDSLLFEQYMNGHGVTELSNSFSMAKSIVSLLIGCALDDGYIYSLNDKMVQYLPELKGPYADELTIRHLLTMSSGSSWNESYSSPFSITTKAYYGDDLGETIQHIEIADEPGLFFNYKSGDTQILAELLTRVTGESLSDYASRKLWKPIGAEQDALWSLDRPRGKEKAYCCFNSSARDFARLGHLVLNKGLWKEKQLVSPQYILQCTTPADYLTDNDGKPVDFYGLQWWMLRYKDQDIPYARGILGQYIFVLPQQDAVIVRLGHKRSTDRRGHHPLDVYTWVELGQWLIDQNHQ